MQIDQTAADPPNHGRICLAISGCTRNSRNALLKMVPANSGLSQSDGSAVATADGVAAASAAGMDEVVVVELMLVVMATPRGSARCLKYRRGTSGKP